MEKARMCRRLGVIAGAAGLAVAVAACGGTNGPSASPGSAGGGGGVTLKMITVGAVPGLTQIDTAFEKSHPGVTIDASSIPTNDYQADLRTELASGNGPDVMSVWAGGGNPMAIQELNAAHDIQSLSNQGWATSLKEIPQVKALDSIDGQQYAITLDLSPAPMAYNQGVLSKYHLTLPATFPQVLSMCKTLNSHGVAMVALGAATGYVNQQVPTMLMDDLISTSDPGFWSDVLSGKTTFQSSSAFRQAALTSYDEYAQMNSAHCFNQGTLSTTYDEAFSLVASGKALMTSALAGYNELSADDPGGSFGTWLLPAGTKPGGTVLTVDTGLTLGVNAHSAHVQQAEEYLQYLSEPHQAAIVTDAGDNLPTVASAQNKPLALFSGVAGDLTSDNVALYISGYWTNPQTKLTQEAEGEDLLDGTASPSAAVKAIEGTFSS
jgi:raffinose/stachyose/melibiose transport system substrate-binding protein